MVRYLLILFIIGIGLSVTGQELNCRVSVVITASNQTNNPDIYRSMETAIREFMNNRKWTNDDYKTHEKIESDLLINITEEVSTEDFFAKVTIKSSRPVFNTSYNTGMLNHVDNEWAFNFNEFDPLEFNENMFTSNLTSLLAFYAYIIIGLDYDSFTLNGGSIYFEKAQTIVNNAQNVSEKGWKSFDSDRNRYWLVENLRNIKYDPIRNVMYKYHRLALDNMYTDVNESRVTILETLKVLLSVNNDNPNSMIMQLFFNAKSIELAELYAQGTPTEKSEVLRILSRLDAARASKYEEYLKN